MEKTWYDEEEDVLNIDLGKGEYWKSVELPDGIVLDISKNGTIISIEILKASKVFTGNIRKVIENAKTIA